ncbi:CLUMA_CG012294, isoform A [Clunio marinus]|uniref:CLUMA_CG012294, isoform A n=1 Tax=Clunio marinus TaxID=568069 RepID=A0A1J1IGR1_9DIPT|nr:CLUMA_CG012294, isoform A [Clunio marinus]
MDLAQIIARCSCLMVKLADCFDHFKHPINDVSLIISGQNMVFNYFTLQSQLFIDLNPPQMAAFSYPKSRSGKFSASAEMRS